MDHELFIPTSRFNIDCIYLLYFIEEKVLKNKNEFYNTKYNYSSNMGTPLYNMALKRLFFKYNWHATLDAK